MKSLVFFIRLISILSITLAPLTSLVPTVSAAVNTASAPPDGVNAAAFAVPLPQTKSIDVVFAMDTSGSMDDDFSALCGNIQGLVDVLKQKGIQIHYQILGINKARECAGSRVPDVTKDVTVDNQEDWAPATRDLSLGYAWQPGATRLIIPMSDEPPENGEPCQSADEDAITTAIQAAVANRVRVAPILAKGYENYSCIEPLAQRLADETGGKLFYSTTPANDLANTILQLIGTVSDDKDGDGIADKDDPYPDNACKPNPQAICLPKQACGVSNTPHWDDDRDSKTDEELPNNQDDDADGLIDEDVGGTNCPFPKQVCGINSHRGFDDDADGKVDEEQLDSKDNDNDGYVDEDVACPCPSAQVLGKSDTPGIDDDRDFKTDEELADSKDNDQDGCIDEDVSQNAKPQGGLKITSSPLSPKKNEPVALYINLDDALLTSGQAANITVQVQSPTQAGLKSLTINATQKTWQVPGNFTFSKPGIYPIQVSLGNSGTIEYPIVVAGQADSTNYEALFLQAAKKGGLPTDGIEIYPAYPTVFSVPVGEKSISDFLNGSMNVTPSITEDYKLRMYAYQYIYPQDTTYVKPDLVKLQRGLDLIHQDEKRATEEVLKNLDEGITLIVYAKEAFVCTAGVVGVAPTGGTGLMLCAPLVIHLGADWVKAWAEQKYKAGEMDDQSYTYIHGGSTVVSASLTLVLSPEGTAAKETLNSVKFATSFIEGSSEMLVGMDSDGIATIHYGNDVIKMVDLSKTASEYASAVTYTIHSPISAEAVDTRGRRIFFDEMKQMIISEIPGATMTLPGMEPQRIRIPNPGSGDFLVNLTGTGSGAYQLDVGKANRGGKMETLSCNGSFSPGEKFTYTTSSVIDASGHIQELRTIPPENEIPSSPGPMIALLIAAAFGVLLLSFVSVSRSRRRKSSRYPSDRSGQSAAPATGYLLIQGKRKLPISDNFLIGAGSECNLRLANPSISRQHARIRCSGGQWFIQDQGSASGIFVNGQCVQATRLRDGDQITLGNIRLTFRERV